MDEIRLSVSKDDPDVAYLILKSHPGEGIFDAVSKQISLAELIENYRGPDVNLDFDNSGVLIGVEVIY